MHGVTPLRSDKLLLARHGVALCRGVPVTGLSRSRAGAGAAGMFSMVLD